MKAISDDAGTIHLLYSAVHQSHKRAPTFWPMQKCTKVLTEVMYRRSGSWRVIGITPAALDAFAAQSFLYKSGMGVQRGHLQPRIETVRQVLAPDEPLSESELFKIWFANDLTVLCSRGENKATVPAYIPIANDDGALFSSHGIGWQHRKKERDFLRELFKR